MSVKLNKLGVKNSLWNNIRANKGSGKKPTKEMLEQERKIKAKMEYGGLMGGDPTKPYHPTNNPDGYREPIYIADRNDPRLRAYNDSLVLYNQSRMAFEDFKPSNLRISYDDVINQGHYAAYTEDENKNFPIIRNNTGNLNNYNNQRAREAFERVKPIGSISSDYREGRHNYDTDRLHIFQKPIQPYKLLFPKREVLTPISNIEPIGISTNSFEPTLIPDNFPKVVYKADEPQASRVHPYSAARELAAMNKPVGYGIDTDGTEVEFSAKDWDKMKGTKYSEFNKPEKKKLGGWLNKYN